MASYVWDLWWTAHQVVHLGNPWFTDHMAAPVGIQLGFNTTMPLAGLVMSPVTLPFGPSAAYNLLTIVMPGLLCYVMYRVGRLWLPADRRDRRRGVLRPVLDAGLAGLVPPQHRGRQPCSCR